MTELSHCYATVMAGKDSFGRIKLSSTPRGREKEWGKEGGGTWLTCPLTLKAAIGKETDQRSELLNCK